jgi:MATE family multidrug resistance protein
VFSLTTLTQLFRLALPMVVSQGAFAIMMFTDRFFLSRISPTHIAASLGGGVTFFVSAALFTGLMSYANALVAQYFGARDMHKCPQVVTQGILIAILCQPLLLLVTLGMANIFAYMDHDPAQVVLERQYYYVLMAGSFFTLVKICFASYFSGISTTRVVMIADLIGVFLNIPLSYVLIFGKLGMPELGIIGAGLGTVMATILTIIIYLLFYFNPIHAERFRVLESFRFHAGIFRRYIRLGLPSALELFIGAATFNFFLLLFQGYGVNEGAAMAIVFNWDMLSFVPLVGLNIAVMSMIGRSVGAGDISQANKVISSGLIIGLSYSGVMGLLFIIYRVDLVSVFATPGTDFSPIVILGSQMMIGMASYVMADAAILVCSGTLRGAGDTRWLMTTSITIHVLMLAIQYVIIKWMGVGPITSWWVFVFTLIALSATYFSRVVGTTWRRPERLAKMMAE